MDVIAPVDVIALGNGNDIVFVINAVSGERRRNRPVGATDNSSMLHFQKLDVYQCSIEFLALTRRVRQRLPKGHADLADQLRRAAQSVPQNIAVVLEEPVFHRLPGLVPVL